MKYHIRAFAENKKAGWELQETATKYVVARSSFEEDIQRTQRHMEKGGAFAGSTPKFFTVPVITLPVK